MTRFVSIVVLLLAAIGMPAICVAVTATDYKCLKGCTQDGQTYNVCMPKCSYQSMASDEAHPHMEYTCLKICMDKDGTAPVCVPHCTTLPADSGMTQLSPQSTQLQTHDVVKAPQPFSGTLLHPHAAEKQAPSIDYNCLNVCAKGGLQYQLCSERCAK